METISLKDQQILPTNEVLENAMGASFQVYSELIESISKPEFGLVPEWKYYNDGKAWLCKVCFKKKTIFWLSVWNQYFKIGFYFTEKHLEGIAGLDIDETIKDNFGQSKHIGKLIPLTLEMRNKEQIADALKIIDFKKKLK